MSETNNNFDDLKQLLKLKRHEIPPPGYFNNFSDEVVSRIRAGEQGGGSSVLEQFQSGSPLLASLLQLVAARPGIIGGMATSVCLLMLIGVLVVDRSESISSPGMDLSMVQTLPSGPASDVSPALASATPLEPADSGITVSTNPVSSLQPVNSLFGSEQNPLFQPVSFTPVKQ